MHRDVSILFLLKISPTVFVVEEGGGSVTRKMYQLGGFY